MGCFGASHPGHITNCDYPDGSGDRGAARRTCHAIHLATIVSTSNTPAFFCCVPNEKLSHARSLLDVARDVQVSSHTRHFRFRGSRRPLRGTTKSLRSWLAKANRMAETEIFILTIFPLTLGSDCRDGHSRRVGTGSMSKKGHHRMSQRPTDRPTDRQRTRPGEEKEPAHPLERQGAASSREGEQAGRTQTHNTTRTGRCPGGRESRAL